MAWNFGESWDLYTSNLSDVLTYWDPNSNFGNCGLPAGRFAGFGRSLSLYGTATLYKTSNVNDAVHHFVVAVMNNTTPSGSQLGLTFTLFDAATAQCSIVFRSDGAILFTSGLGNGTVLGTWTGAFPLANVWYAFEFEVVINNTTGSFAVRRNGNLSSDFSLTGQNTRASANNYANKVQIYSAGSSSNYSFDDFYWRSDASAVAWMGDVRCYTRMPLNDIAVQFTRGSSTVTGNNGALWSSASFGANAAYYTPFVPTFSGTISSATVGVNTAATGHIKAAIFDNTGGGGNPGAILGGTAVLTNPTVGNNTVTFSPPVTVVKGQTYYLGTCQDVPVSYQEVFTGGALYVSSASYASFPVANPPNITSGPWQTLLTWSIAITRNADFVNEAQEDGATTTVTDTVVGHNDLYSIAPITATPATTIAVTTRGYVQKTDAGSRAGAIQLKSGSTTVQTPAPGLSPGNWTWLSRMDLVDPATGAAWTPSAVAAAQIGPIIIV